jgi:hypothetical protein
MLYITNPCKSWKSVWLLHQSESHYISADLYSVVLTRTSSWPNPVEVNTLVYSTCPIQFNWLSFSHSPKQSQQYQQSLPISQFNMQEAVSYCCAPWVLCRYQVVMAHQISDIFVRVTIAIIKQAFGNETTYICHWKYFHFTCTYSGTHSNLCFFSNTNNVRKL